MHISRVANTAVKVAVAMQLWRHAMNFTAEVVLEGIAKAGSRGKCTPMGRAAMSLDLQVIQESHAHARCAEEVAL